MSTLSVRSLENAIFLPSGDHAGPALRACVPDVRFVSPLPAESITKMSVLPADVASRLLSKAIRVLSGEYAGAASTAVSVDVSGTIWPRSPLTTKRSLAPGVTRSLAKATGSAGSGAESGGGGSGGVPGVTVIVPRIGFAPL